MSKARMQKIKGIEYVYIETSHRVAGRNYPDHKRMYIGKMTIDGFFPNAKFHALSEEEKKTTGLAWESTTVKVGHHRRGRPYAPTEGSRKFRGTDLLFSTIADTIGLDDDLARVFGDRDKQIRSLAYYLMANPEAPLYRFSSWARLHCHPFGDDIPSPRSSELLGSITEDEIQQFLRLRVRRATGNSGWLAVDTTSISSYSQALSLVAKGHNKEHDRLEQVNLLMVFDQDTDVPVFYRKLRGNITDVTTVENTLHDLRGVGIEGASLVLDRGFYSEDNVKTLLKKRYPFTIGTKISVAFVMEAIRQTRKSMLSFDSYDEEHKIFHAVVPVAYAVPVRGRGPNSRTAYLHLYCSKEREADDSAALMKRLKRMRSQLESGTIAGNRKALEKFFTFTGDSNGTIVLFSEKQEAINDAMDRCGFFALLTSEKNISSIDVLTIYRLKDRVEKAYNNLKDRLQMRRTACSKDENFSGKVFVQFVALMVLSHLRKVMADKKLYLSISYRQLLDEVDVIEYFEYAGQQGHWGEITVKQGLILRAFDVDLPFESWPKSIQKEILKEQKAKKKIALNV